jgi:hypothetical protein
MQKQVAAHATAVFPVVILLLVINFARMAALLLPANVMALLQNLPRQLNQPQPLLARLPIPQRQPLHLLPLPLQQPKTRQPVAAHVMVGLLIVINRRDIRYVRMVRNLLLANVPNLNDRRPEVLKPSIFLFTHFAFDESYNRC